VKRPARSLVALLVGLAPLAVAASCGKEGRESTNPGWFAQCTSDVDCTVGACLCGRCSVTCGEYNACSSGPAGSDCFARGSIAHEALCGDSAAPAALCLATCGNDSDCPAGLTCAVGACLPPHQSPLIDAGSSAGKDDACAGKSCSGVQTAEQRRAFNERALLPPEFHWAPEVIGDDEVYTDDGPARVVEYDEVCRPSNPCPTLEQVLADDACLELIKSCDLLRVTDPYGAYMYWYTGYGTPPVAALRNASGATYGRFGATRELICTTTEITICSTCGVDRPRCEDVPGGLPPPPAPLPVNGCECESDGQGGARVSLDCFCSIHDCTPLADMRDDCRFDEGETSTFTHQAADACGQIWFWTNELSGRQLAYDASGALVGAVAFSQGPVTAPCNTVRVSAGVIADCPEAATCDCNLGFVDPPGFEDTACEAREWFQAL
jgi:hypothetical protein